MARNERKANFIVGSRRINKKEYNSNRTMMFDILLYPNPNGYSVIRLLAINSSGGMSEVLGWSKSKLKVGDDRPEEYLSLTATDNNGQNLIAAYYPDGVLIINSKSGGPKPDNKARIFIDLGGFTVDELPEHIDFISTRDAFLQQVLKRNFRQPVLVPE